MDEKYKFSYSASATETTLNFFIKDECLQPSVVTAPSLPREFDNAKGMPEVGRTLQYNPLIAPMSYKVARSVFFIMKRK